MSTLNYQWVNGPEQDTRRCWVRAGAVEALAVFVEGAAAEYAICEETTFAPEDLPDLQAVAGALQALTVADMPAPGTAAPPSNRCE